MRTSWRLTWGKVHYKSTNLRSKPANIVKWLKASSRNYLTPKQLSRTKTRWSTRLKAFKLHSKFNAARAKREKRRCEEVNQTRLCWRRCYIMRKTFQLDLLKIYQPGRPLLKPKCHSQSMSQHLYSSSSLIRSQRSWTRSKDSLHL